MKKNANDFQCGWCDPYISFINNLKKKEGAASSKPEELPTLVPNAESDVMQVGQLHQDDENEDQNDAR